MTREPDDERIRAALEDLNRLIAERVQREQRRDQLTGLPNELALDECLERHIEEGRDILAAFVEVDRFKSINDRFGYQKADELLKDLGRLLKDLSRSFPGAAGAVEVFRPTAMSSFSSECTTGRTLIALMRCRPYFLTCAKVRELSLPVVRVPNEAPEKLACTVSVGWLVSADIPSPQTSRAVRDCLERAVDEAKRTRDCAVRYSTKLRHRQSASLRADCSSCSSKFTVDIPLDANRAGPLHCPNCGEQVTRPPTPVVQASITPPVEV